MSVLELGCGTGQLLLHLRQLLPEAKLCGVTCCQEEAVCAQKNGVADYLVGEIDTLDLSEKYDRFNLVIFSSILHHFPDPAIPVRCAKKHLLENGLIISYDPNYMNPFFALYRNPKSPFFFQQGTDPQ